VAQVGVRWAERQSAELLERGVPALHYYVMQSSKAVMQLLDNLEIPVRARQG
jgi:methylenetetrahydrofolate reductase (NADPH)